jgi:hypothetical protein
MWDDRDTRQYVGAGRGRPDGRDVVTALDEVTVHCKQPCKFGVWSSFSHFRFLCVPSIAIYMYIVKCMYRIDIYLQYEPKELLADRLPHVEEREC